MECKNFNNNKKKKKKNLNLMKIIKISMQMWRKESNGREKK